MGNINKIKDCEREIMFFKKWFEKRRQKQEEIYNDKKIKYHLLAQKGGIEEYKGVFEINDSILPLFKRDKDYFYYPVFEDFEDKVLGLIQKIVVDSELRDNISQFKLPGSEQSFLGIMIRNIDKLSQKTQVLLFLTLPTEDWFESSTINKNKDESDIILSSAINDLLSIKPNSFNLLLKTNTNVKNEIFNLEHSWTENKDVQLNVFSAITPIIKRLNELEKKEKLTKKEIKKRSYLMNAAHQLLSIMEVIPVKDFPDTLFLKVVEICFKHIISSDQKIIDLVLNNDKVNDVLILTIPFLLEKYNQEDNIVRKEEIINNMNKIFIKNNYTPDKIHEESFINKTSPLNKDTLQMWVNNFTDEKTRKDQIVTICSNLFVNKDFELFDFFIKENNEEYYVKKLQDLFYKSLSLDVFKDIFFEDMDSYLNYFYSNTDLKLNNSFDFESKYYNLMEHAIDENVSLTEEQIKVLKKYEFNPFEKNENNTSFYEMANVETKRSVAMIYLKEMALFEKEMLSKSIIDDDIKTNNIKKRL